MRVRITHQGKPVAAIPAEAVAVSYGLWDHADGFASQPDSAFYVAGSFTMTLAPGTDQLVLSKGNEYVKQTHTVTIKPGLAVRQTYRLTRWINMAARGCIG